MSLLNEILTEQGNLDEAVQLRGILQRDDPDLQSLHNRAWNLRDRVQQAARAVCSESSPDLSPEVAKGYIRALLNTLRTDDMLGAIEMTLQTREAVRQLDGLWRRGIGGARQTIYSTPELQEMWQLEEDQEWREIPSPTAVDLAGLKNDAQK